MVGLAVSLALSLTLDRYITVQRQKSIALLARPLPAFLIQCRKGGSGQAHEAKKSVQIENIVSCTHSPTSLVLLCYSNLHQA